MKIDTLLDGHFDDVSDRAAECERDGYDGLWLSETNHDPFLQVLQAMQGTARPTVGTSVAIAFGRSPLTLAHTSFDLARFSGGRFILGLGSQVKPHIERRYSMPWSRPAARMREFILALRAIWSCWQDETGLSFEGEFYTHTLMAPFFSPSPHGFGSPPVFLAAVGERMTEVAGEVGDGFFVHPFTTRTYFDAVTLPALLRGRERAGLTGLGGFTVAGPSLVAVGRDEEELAVAVQGTKQQIAFYASTPTYRGVLEQQGYGDLQLELTRLSKRGHWAQMSDLIDDVLLHQLAIVGDPATVGSELKARWGDVYDRISLYANYPVSVTTLLEVAATLRVPDDGARPVRTGQR